MELRICNPLTTRKLAVAQAAEALRWAESRVRAAHKSKKSKTIIIGREAAMRSRLHELIVAFHRLETYKEEHAEEIPLGDLIAAW
jgi:Tfp pilus assembly protein PilX